MSGPNFGRYIVNAIVAGIVGRGVQVIKTEVENAKNEFQAKLKSLSIGAAMVGVSLAFVTFGLILLMVAGLIALTEIWPAWLVALTGGGAVLLLGFIVMAIGASKIKKNKDLMPDQAIRNIKAIFNP